MSKFITTTSMALYVSGCDEAEVDLVITAQYRKGYAGSLTEPGEPASVEVLRVEVRDAKTRTLHMLPEYLVDVITGNTAMHEWLLDEWSAFDAAARERMADERREERRLAS